MRSIGVSTSAWVTIPLYRWAAGDPNRLRQYAADLVAGAPEVILATGTFGMTPLQQITRTVPIVFVDVLDPVGSGFVSSLAHPGGNATGFTNSEYGIGAKWLDILKNLAPSLRRVAVLRDPTVASGSGQLGAMQSIGSSLGLEIFPVGVRDPNEIDNALNAFAGAANGGMVVTTSALTIHYRDAIIKSAIKHHIPAVYPYRFFVAEGGLISYGPDQVDPYRRAAGYVDRILRGEKPSDLPVQAPTKFELVINLKTAKALGLVVPPSLLATADEVIE